MRNVCVNLQKKPRKTILQILNKLCSSNKVKAKPTIKLAENDKIIDKETKIAKKFNQYFVDFVKKLAIFTEKESVF